MDFPCFPAGTRVLMADGSTKPIEDIQKGDWVLADDPEDGEAPKAYKVIGTSINETDRFVVLSIDESGDGVGDSILEATTEHPVWTVQHGWLSAKDLNTGDLLIDEHGENVNIVSISERKVSSFTFNLTVEGVHTFYVLSGNTPVLVHNQQLEFDFAADAKNLLRDALSQQGLSTPPTNFKQEWTANGFDYEVRIHPDDPAWGKQGDIVRVGRRQHGLNSLGQGHGWEYVDDKGNWWKKSHLKPQNPNYNKWAAEDSHIE